jgi:hypothetical protein
MAAMMATPDTVSRSAAAYRVMKTYRSFVERLTVWVLQVFARNLAITEPVRRVATNRQATNQNTETPKRT